MTVLESLPNCDNSQRIRREILTHSLLDHPHVIRFLGVVQEKAYGPPLIILPLVENGSLEHWIEDRFPTGADFAKIVGSLIIACQSTNIQ